MVAARSHAGKGEVRKRNAVAVYVLVAIIKKELNLKASLHTLLQISSLTLFEKVSLQQTLAEVETDPMSLVSANQLNLFDS